MCPLGSITALWLCFSCVLVHNNKCVQGRILRLKKGGGGGHTFRVEIGAARKPRPPAFAYSSLAVCRSKANKAYSMHSLLEGSGSNFEI